MTLSPFVSSSVQRASRACKGMTVALGVFVIAAAAMPASAQPNIAIIGGKKGGMAAGQHDFPNGAIKLGRLIEASPEFSGMKAVVKTYPAGFPQDMAELKDASVIVLYNGSVSGASGSVNPTLDPKARDALGALVKRGVGIVALHQSFTVTANDDKQPILNWVGATRPGGTDYSMEVVPVTPISKSHPVTNGVGSFDHFDEHYSSIDFAPANVTPLLSARTHIQHSRGKAVYEDPAKDRVIAWAYDRPDGGRAVGFTGGHFIEVFDQPAVRTLVLNAIMWAAKSEVPQAGVTTTLPAAARIGMAPPPEPQKIVRPASEVVVESTPWGKLEWFAHRSLGNTANVTVGRATIAPGQQNPVHWHPNCDEVLYVMQGHIMHRVGDKEYEMRAGDTVVIPEGVDHNARNIGTEDAILYVSFNSADRVAIGY